MADVHAIMRFAGRRRRKERIFRERVVMRVIPDHHFVDRYRLDKEAVGEVINLVGNDLQREMRGGNSISVETQVLASLRFLAKGAFFSEVADTHGVSRSSVCQFLHTFVNSLNRGLDNIRFPKDRHVAVPIKRAFYRKCRLPNIIGAIDGTLIPITAPIEHEAPYVCRKGYHAINCQAVCSHDMRFKDIVAKWPGSTHDAAVFENCRLKEYLETRDGDVLLGDAGYPLRGYLLTPILRATNDMEETYNRRHKRGRAVIERSFGLLKARFRCLHRTGGVLQFSPLKAAGVFEACCRLHNLCMDRGMPEPDNVVDDFEEDDEHVVDANARGMAIRQRYMQL